MWSLKFGSVIVHVKLACVFIHLIVGILILDPNFDLQTGFLWIHNLLLNLTPVCVSACYGIVTVPTGPWFCRKCESQERAVRVVSNVFLSCSSKYILFCWKPSNVYLIIDVHFQRCELCPIKEGALKRTDNQAWAHVICALYIPEVRFGNVTTMEPIILQLVPAERFSKVSVLIILSIYTMWHSFSVND